MTGISSTPVRYLQVTRSGSVRSVSRNTFRFFDARIAALEGELEEEQTQSEMLMERARKSQINIEQLTTELASERGNCQKMENTKMMLERQNKELKAKLEEVENSNRAKAKAAIGKCKTMIYTIDYVLWKYFESKSSNKKIRVNITDVVGESRGKECKSSDYQNCKIETQ